MTPARLFASALFYALLAASNGYSSARIGPTWLGIVQATIMLSCAVLAYQRAAVGWAMWRRGVAWERAVGRVEAERRRQRDAVDRALGNGGHS